MIDLEARTIIEALRSGIPSKEVGRYFSEARPSLMNKVLSKMDEATSGGKSCGMIVVGKYGEGKTHLLNAIDCIASESNMVVSHVCLGKETPIDKLHILFQKLMANTFLPGKDKPGFLEELSNLTPESPVALKMLDYCSNELETNKLYYVLRSLVNSDNPDDRYRLIADLQGDLLPNPNLRAIAKGFSAEKVRFNVPFAKTRHMKDYFFFMSHFFRLLGFSGWAILFDETELIGRMSKKSRMLGYANIAEFLKPEKKLENAFSLFALSASYEEDVIESKNEYENAQTLFPENRAIPFVLDSFKRGAKLLPLSKDELRFVFEKLQQFHGSAYSWQPNVSIDVLLKQASDAGFLLRTKIRYAIEFLDQLYQYGEAGKTKVDELGRETFEEEILLDEDNE